MHLELRSAGIVVSAKRVMRLMTAHGLVPLSESVKRYSSYKGEIGGAPANLVNRDFHAANPNELWVTDITEFRIPAGKVYLSPVIDCYDGMPVAWTIGTSPNAALANGMPECIASMFVGRVRQCFSAVWADGFPRCRHRFPVM